MPFKILSAAEVAATYRKTRASSVSGLPEWADLMKALAKGLKPGETAVVEFVPKDKKDTARAKSTQANFKRNTRKYLSKNKLPYAVRAMKDARGGFVVLVTRNKG